MSTMIDIQQTIQKDALYINKARYVGINVDRIITGTEDPNSVEIVKDKSTGLNVARERVVPTELYNKRKQHFNGYFMLALETGGRGWYPGCFIYGDIVGSAQVYTEPSESSSQISIISDSLVKILDLDQPDDQSPYGDWYKIKFDIVGFVKKSALRNLRYTNI